MRVAICMWGVLRSLPLTLPSLKKHLFDVLDNASHVYDVYMHTYMVSERYTNLRSQERDVALNHSHWQLLQPAYVFVEDQTDFDRRLNISAYLEPFGNPWGDMGTFTNHLRALNSLYHVTEALEAAARSGTVQYDAVVFIRPDLLLLNDLPLHLLDAFPASTVFAADFHRSCHGAELNDRFADDLEPTVVLTNAGEFGHGFVLAGTVLLHILKQKPAYDLLDVTTRVCRLMEYEHLHPDLAAVRPSQQPASAQPSPNLNLYSQQQSRFYSTSRKLHDVYRLVLQTMENSHEGKASYARSSIDRTTYKSTDLFA